MSQGLPGITLLNPEQRFFGYASHDLSLDEAEQLVRRVRAGHRIQMPELKAAKLLKTRRGRGIISDVLEAMDGRYVATVYDKKLSLAGKLFEYIYEPVLQANNDGSQPWAGLMEANDGSFYGTTEAGGDHGKGTIFKVALLVNSTLTVTLVGQGAVRSTDSAIECPGFCSYRYTDPSTVVMGAVPDSAYSFSGWTGCDNVNDGRCVVTMTESKM